MKIMTGEELIAGASFMIKGKRVRAIGFVHFTHFKLG